MRWGNAIWLALAVAVIAAVAAGYVADLATVWLHVSRMEGYASVVVLLWIVLGFIGGFVLALTTARLVGSPVWAFGVSAGAVLGIAGLVALGAWSVGDPPPAALRGRPMVLEVELGLPPGHAADPRGLTVPRTGDLGDILFTIRWNGGHAYAFLEPDAARREDGRWVIPGRFPVTVGRLLDLQLFGRLLEGHFVYFPLALPTPLSPGDGAWSPWLPGRSSTQPAPPVAEGYVVRYRLAWAPP